MDKIKKEKFTIKQFNEKYIDDNACLHQIFLNRYSYLENCPKCNDKFSYHKVTDRKCYACAYCGNQLHPLADTIFHKSSTSLKNWFYAIFLFSTSKNGVSAKELERQLGVTYKCAYRIAKQIRKLFDENVSMLKLPFLLVILLPLHHLKSAPYYLEQNEFHNKLHSSQKLKEHLRPLRILYLD